MKYVCPICGKTYFTTADVAKCTAACQADIELKEKLAKEKAEYERKKTAAAKAAETKAREAEAAQMFKELQDCKSDLKDAYSLVKEQVDFYNLAVDFYNKKYAGKVPNATSTLSFGLEKYEPEEGEIYQLLKGITNLNESLFGKSDTGKDNAGKIDIGNLFKPKSVTDPVFKVDHEKPIEDDLRDIIRKSFGF